MNVVFDQPEYFALLLLLPAVAFLGWRFLKWRSQVLENFAESRFLQYLNIRTDRFSAWILIPLLGALLLTVIAAADSLGGKEEIKVNLKVNNVLYLLDVSNSMNAEDTEPNRLTRAKEIILRTMDKTPQNKVGLIVFAGNAVSLMPLTSDYEAAKIYLQNLTTDVIKVQGTDFRMPVGLAAEKLSGISGKGKTIVIVSDGEDNEGNMNDAKSIAKKNDIKIFTVGMGTEEGAPIPEYSYGQLMGYKIDRFGNEVLTKRKTRALENMAEDTGGAYIDGSDPAKAANILANDLKKNISSAEVSVKTQASEHYFQYFLLAAIVLLLVIYLFNPRKDFNL